MNLHSTVFGAAEVVDIKVEITKRIKKLKIMKEEINFDLKLKEF